MHDITLQSRERGPLVAAVAAVAGLAILVALALGGMSLLTSAPPLPAPPAATLAHAPAPVPVARTVPAAAATTPTAPPRPHADHIPRAWEASFFPLYGRAQATFGVNWLLIASIHAQETAFSTARDTYHGLNFAGCCGGPMQFNVTNGPVTTWSLVSGAYRFARRPRTYLHRSATHPSIYDDFDAIMAGAWLLYSDGAGMSLDGDAWRAAYDYYGHDAFGVSYADTVLARAIGWSQHGFCANCSPSPQLVSAVHAAYGAPVAASLASAPAAAPAAGAARAG